MRYGHDSGIKHAVEFRHVQKENRNQQSKYNRRYKVPIEAMFGDGQATSPECEQVEPLPVVLRSI